MMTSYTKPCQGCSWCSKVNIFYHGSVSWTSQYYVLLYLWETDIKHARLRNGFVTFFVASHHLSKVIYGRGSEWRKVCNWRAWLCENPCAFTRHLSDVVSMHVITPLGILVFSSCAGLPRRANSEWCGDADTNRLLDLWYELRLALVVQVWVCTYYIETATGWGTRRRGRGYTGEERPR